MVDPQQKSKEQRRNLISPILVSSYKFAILGSLTYFKPFLINPFSLHNVLFWTVSGLASFIYLICCWGDPGYQVECPSQWLENDHELPLNKRTHLKRLREQFNKPTSKEPIKTPIIENSSNSSSSDDEGEQSDNSSPSPAHSSILTDEPFLVSKENFDFSLPHDTHEGGVAVMSKFNHRNTFTRNRSTSMDQSEFIHLEISSATSIDPVEGARTVITVLQPPDNQRHNFVRGLASTLCVPLYLTKAGGKKLNSLLKTFFRRIAYWSLFQMRSIASNIRIWTRLAATPFIGPAFPEPALNGPFESADPVCKVNELITIGLDNLYQRNEPLTFCTHCSQWRLLRTRHCRDCKRCVRVFDHHCPWLGVCVGECNRTIFLYFLLIQSFELLWTTILIGNEILLDDLTWLDSDSLWTIIPRVLLLIQSLVLISLAMMTGSLFIYQAILLAMNITTWEMMSWNRISYLKNRQPLTGSPFGCDTLQKNCQVACVPPNSLQMIVNRISCLGNNINTSNNDRTLPTFERFIWGPGNTQIWIIKERGDIDFDTIPKALNPGCCNLYSVCI